MSTEKIPSLGTEDAISLNTGIEWTTNWRNWCLNNGFTEENMLRAFFIPIDDITALANTAGADGARAYLALEVAGDPSTVKVVLAPTETTSAGPAQDMVEPITPDPSPDQPYSIYDMTRPCPKFCDLDSPLYDGVIPTPPASSK